ncbi:L-ascorbate metabolism protein UlaG, beta-lactamase superfamily [Desulfonatronum zhilinae]|nr:L-ascorbate metabolism protein UlaG, beta-lactamase superfamily [Desulfonatronum zhilinae]
MKSIVLLAVILMTPLVAGCSGKNPHYDPDKPHHTPTGFQNNYPHSRPSGPDFWRWFFQRRLAGLPKKPTLELAPVAPDLEYLRTNLSEPAVTWIGHATVLMQMGGLNILTDPVFSQRASPVQWAGPKRWQPPGVALDELPRIDLVLISHSHYDHLDLNSVREVAAQPGGSPLFMVPLGLKEWFERNVPASRGHVRDFDWWDNLEMDGEECRTTVHFVPAQHWSQRTLRDRNQTLWGGWVVEQPDFVFYYAGDMGYSQDTKDIGERFGGFDLAAIPVGAYEPRWFMQSQHINPEEAVLVHRDVQARRSIGVHWGTFHGITDESLDQPIVDLAEARQRHGLAEDDFFLLRHGETRRLDDNR